jgi:hypothetical protein
MGLFPQLFRRGGTSTAPRPPTSQRVVLSGAPNGAPGPRLGNPAGNSPQEDLDLPEGWEIAEYAGDGGQTLFAVYFNGRRMASGMTSLRSAARWARLLAVGQP